MNRLTLKEESEILAAQERGFVPTEEDNGYDFVTLSDARTFNEKHAKPCACAFHRETGVSITPKTRETTEKAIATITASREQEYGISTPRNVLAQNIVSRAEEIAGQMITLDIRLALEETITETLLKENPIRHLIGRPCGAEANPNEMITEIAEHVTCRECINDLINSYLNDLLLFNPDLTDIASRDTNT